MCDGAYHALTHFSEAFVLIDFAVECYGCMGGVLQQVVGKVARLGVLLDGLEQEGVAGYTLDWHHQEET